MIDVPLPRLKMRSIENGKPMERRSHLSAMSWMHIFLMVLALTFGAKARKPNVVLILTDDQGYGDLSCHGNPLLKTPELDRLHADSIRFTDMHANPFCTPTRAALMTGHYATRTGAYRTSAGRDRMHSDEKTMAQFFGDSGYATGLFGKWHLGDNYPHRPQDRGFQEVLWHRCGGIGQSADYWGNDYFDDTYERNGKFEKFKGYCTDIWFEEALGFIEMKAREKKPFFVYLATNAPHSPFRVAASYEQPYRKSAAWRKGKASKFYGMIANLDENVGKLRRKLKSWGLAENTILIFMTDNGTSGGVEMETDGQVVEGKGFNAGMRGRKASVYDGGHRVPFFVHWPEGGWTGGRDIATLVAAYDVLPTLIELCGLGGRKNGFDGRSLAPLLAERGDWPERELVLQYQGGNGFTYLPEKWSDSVVMTERWRLVDGRHLFDIEKDPSQRHDVAPDHPETVRRLRIRYEEWWEEVSPRMRPVRIHVGHPAQPRVTLTPQDWYTAIGNPQTRIREPATVSAPLMLHVARSGVYRVTLSQYPLEAHQPMASSRAVLRIAGKSVEKRIKKGESAVSFELRLMQGDANMEALLRMDSGQEGSAYYVYVERIDD